MNVLSKFAGDYRLQFLLYWARQFAFGFEMVCSNNCFLITVIKIPYGN